MPRRTYVPSERSVSAEVGTSQLTEESSTVREAGGGASLVAQWLRVCLPMQGTRVRALVWEDPT